jgi:hypothetical protein
VWISPPDYTGAAPLYLGAGDHRAAAPLAVPAGSEIVVAVKGGADRPTLTVDEAQVAFDHIGERDFYLTYVIEAGRGLIVEQETNVLGAWSLRLIPDMPPSVALVDVPRPTARNSVRVHHGAADDYGVEALVLEIARGLEPELLVPILLAAARRSFDGISHHDLTAHRWAGLDVTLRLLATDGAHELVGGKWFRHHIVDQKVEVVGAALLLSVAGDQDDPHLRELLPDLECKRDPIHHRMTI